MTERAGFFTDFLSERLLDHAFGRVQYKPPRLLYIGLSRLLANREGNVLEPVGNGYQRSVIINDRMAFAMSARGRKVSAEQFLFPQPEGLWGLIWTVFVADAREGGNVLTMTELKDAEWIHSFRGRPKVDAGDMLFSYG